MASAYYSLYYYFLSIVRKTNFCYLSQKHKDPNTITEFNLRTALLQGSQAESLIIKEGLFSEERLTNLTEKQCRKQKLRLSMLLQTIQQYLFYYKYFFTYPYQLPEEPILNMDEIGEIDEISSTTTGPKGTNNAFIRNVLYGIEPIFTKLEPNYFEDSFKILDQAFIRNVSSLDSNSLEEYKAKILSALLEEPMLEERDYEHFVAAAFQSVMRPCLGLLRFLRPVARLVGKLRLTYRWNNVRYSLYPDILVGSKGTNKNLLVIELKKSGLDEYIVNDELVEDNDDFNSIIEQVTAYLIASNLDEAIISDFRVSIYLRPQIKEYKDKADMRKKYPVLTKTKTVRKRDGTTYEEDYNCVKVPYGYRIIRNTDCGVTLQAVVSSMVYRESLFNSGLLPQRPAQNLTGKAWDDHPDNSEDPDEKDDNFPDPVKKAVKHVKQILFQSDTDQTHTASSIAKEQTERIVHLIQNTRMYSEVNTFKFNEIVIVDLDEDLVPIRTGPNFLSQVYLFPYEKYCETFKNRGVSGNVPETVVLKVYDFTQLQNYENEDIEKLRYKGLYDVNETYNLAASLMLNEVACYERIQSSKENIRVPELYDYGIMMRRFNGYPVSTGYYLLMTYIEGNEEDKKIQQFIQSTDDMKENFPFDFTFRSGKNGVGCNERVFTHQLNEDLNHQVSLLKKIGVSHNDLVSRNLVVTNGKYTIIDFSHGSVSFNSTNPVIPMISTEAMMRRI